MEFKFARGICYIGLIVGVWRLAEFYLYGDLHQGHAIAWAVHALVSAPLALWLIRREEKKVSGG